MPGLLVYRGCEGWGPHGLVRLMTASLLHGAQTDLRGVQILVLQLAGCVILLKRSEPVYCKMEVLPVTLRGDWENWRK